MTQPRTLGQSTGGAAMRPVVCPTENFIRDCAARSWSRAMTRQHLDLSRERFRLILDVIEQHGAIEWARSGHSLLAKQSHAGRRGICLPEMAEGMARGRHTLYTRAIREGDGLRGTCDELAKNSPVSAATIRRRLAAGQSLAEAVNNPPKPYSERRRSKSK